MNGLGRHKNLLPRITLYRWVLGMGSKDRKILNGTLAQTLIN